MSINDAFVGLKDVTTGACLLLVKLTSNLLLWSSIVAVVPEKITDAS